MKPGLAQTKKNIVHQNIFQKPLLYCGIFSSIWYFVINVIAPVKYPGYSVISQTVSELSAIDTPTRTLWVILCIFYTLLLVAFGSGVWLSGNGNKKLKLAGIVIIFDAIFGSFWPPMHQREVIAAGEATLTDTLHIIWTFIHLILVVMMILFGALAMEKRFRIYSIATIIIFFVFGILTSMESPNIEAGTPTPYIGIWERVNMAAYMIWIIVFAETLLQRTGIKWGS